MKRFAIAFGIAATALAGVGWYAFGQAAPSKITVVLGANTRAALEPLVAKFNASRTDVQIDPIWGGDQTQLIAARKIPDIIGTGDLYIEGQRELMLNLNDLMAADQTSLDAADFYPQMITPLRLSNQQLALPYRFNVGLLYYNKTLFNEAKVALPTARWTQADFISAAQKLTKSDGTRATQWGSSTVFGWWGEWLIHVRQAGGEFMRGTTVTLGSQEAIAGLQFFFDRTTAGKYKFAPGPKDDNLGGFQGMKTAMEYGGHTGLWAGFNQVKGLDWDIEVLPKGIKQQRGAELALEGYGVYKGTQNPKAAYEVLKFLTGKEFMTTSFTDLGYPPARRSVARIVLSVPKAKRNNPQNLEALFAGITTGMTLPRNKNFVNTAIQVVQPEIDKMLEGKQTPAETAARAADRATKYLQSQK
jgi:multiple sugar transport system substrate-binding protein